MNALKHVFDGTLENFRQLVLENSHKGVVLVNYWTPNAGPCFKLWQTLESLSNDYQGRFLLVNVNTESQGKLARDNGITSVPTIKIYQQGQVVDSIYGAHSETSLRATLDSYVPPPVDPAVSEAIRIYQSGNVEDALGLLAEASRRQPDNTSLYATALKLLLREKRYADLDTCYFALPADLQRHTELSALQVHGQMLHRVAEAPGPEALTRLLDENPDDLEALINHAALAMSADEFDTALQDLLRAFKIDRNYAGEFPRRAMLAIFMILGDRHELTGSYQQRLLDAMN